MTTPLRHAIRLALLISVVVLVKNAVAQSATPSVVVAAHDPPDIPFRRAPMGLSSRSIVVSLATNLHLAFDAQLLRTHTVWEGPPLNLYGPPFTGTASRFICDYTGNRLWGNPPFQEWSGSSIGDSGTFEPNREGRFRGISTKGNVTTFIYDVVTSGGVAIRVHESARLETIDGHAVLVRRFEVAACDRTLELLAHREPGRRFPERTGYTGNYHSFATGPGLDALGNLYVLVTGHRTIYDVPMMGWCVRVAPEVQGSKFKVQGSSIGDAPLSTGYHTEPFCSGLRVPNGFGTYAGDIFMTDNQGHWIAANKLNHLQAGKFYGHPSSRPAPLAQFDGDPNFTPPAVWFPYAWVRSASGIATIPDDRFGPFQGQMLVGEFQNASVFRVALEKVNGEWQGAVFPFVKGFASGVNRLAFGSDGKLYAGGLRMGHWTSIAPQPHSLDRVSFTGRVPFEVKEVHARPDGFELVFTQPVDATSAGDAENWDAAQYTYAYDGIHKAPEKDRDEKIPGPAMRVTKAVVSGDRLTVRLHTEGQQPRHVIMIRALGVKNADGKKLRNDTFHYTLNQIPQ